MESLLLIFPARAIVQRMPAQWAKKCANALHCTFGGPQLCQCNLAFESRCRKYAQFAVLAESQDAKTEKLSASHLAGKAFHLGPGSV